MNSISTPRTRIMTATAGVVAALAISFGAVGCSTQASTPPDADATAEAPATEAPAAEETAAPAAPEYTVSQQSAIDKANSYLQFQPFSRQGLINQLTSQFDGFSVEDATFAVDAINADWNAQAALKAQQYMDTVGGFSRQSLLDQLTSQIEGFTPEQAEFGVASVGL